MFWQGLANKNSLVFTNVFGGTSGNEGLGLLSISFDWQYITISSLFLLLITLTNSFFGFLLCIILLLSLYYGNIWNARQFPFLSQQLFSQTSNSSHYAIFNQSLILDANSELNTAALTTTGIPFFAASNASYFLTTNLGITATITHILLWDRAAVKNAFNLGRWSSFKSLLPWGKRPAPTEAQKLVEAEEEELDPHYQQMLAYDEVPSWWYITILVVSMATALFCIYNLKSTLPWWGFLIACMMSFLSTLFFGAMAGLIGFNVPITSIIQLIGGYLHPGKPLANMFFVLFDANSQAQALFLIENLKLGQYGKLTPKCTFTVQIFGTVLGAIMNYILMTSITTNQREVLLSIEGSNIWSGQVI